MAKRSTETFLEILEVLKAKRVASYVSASAAILRAKGLMLEFRSRKGTFMGRNH